MTLDELAASLNALERTDAAEFQRRARVLQSMWREEQGIPCGEHRCRRAPRPLGSRLPMPRAEEALENFLTERIRAVVRMEVCDTMAAKGKLYGRPRIFNDLLSSQPLCFNLFGELTYDLGLTSALISELTDGRFTQVTSIDFEHSPGRGDPRYLNDRSAFDVFLGVRTATGGRGFVGIEAKYHESLAGAAGNDKPRYSEVAGMMGCFGDDFRPFKVSPLQQIWRDHLLTGIARIEDGYEDALFVMLYPRGNTRVSVAQGDYRSLLSRTDSFDAWTLEDFVDSLLELSDAAWIDAFIDRYLAFEKIDERLGTAEVEM